MSVHMLTLCLSCLTAPLFLRGLHLLRVLHSLCPDTSCHCSGPLPLHHGLPALQLPLHPVEDRGCGAVDLAAGSGHQLPSPDGLELCQLRGPHVQLCRELGQQSQLHGLHGRPLLPRTCGGHPLLLREHCQGGTKPRKEDSYLRGRCPEKQESDLCLRSWCFTSAASVWGAPQPLLTDLPCEWPVCAGCH